MRPSGRASVVPAVRREGAMCPVKVTTPRQGLQRRLFWGRWTKLIALGFGMPLKPAVSPPVPGPVLSPSPLTPAALPPLAGSPSPLPPPQRSCISSVSLSLPHWRLCPAQEIPRAASDFCFTRLTVRLHEVLWFWRQTSEFKPWPCQSLATWSVNFSHTKWGLACFLQGNEKGV